MVDSSFLMTLPINLKKLVYENIDLNKLKTSGIVIQTCKEKPFRVENNGVEIIGYNELYKHMAQNFDWLLDHLSIEQNYEKPYSKFKSKIGHLLGVTDDYLLDEVRFEPNFKLDSNSKDSRNGSSPSDKDSNSKNQPNSSNAVVNDNANKKRKIAKADDLVFDFSSFSGDLKIFDNLKKVLQTVPNPPDFKDTLLYQQMKPRSGPLLDTTKIERKMFNHYYDKTLAQILISAFEKSSLEDYLKLVKHFSIGSSVVNKKDLRCILSWKAWLLNGFNLVFCGNGSTRNILNIFSHIALRDGNVLTINGYAIKGSDSYLWNYLCDKIAGIKCVSKSEALKRVAKIVRSFTCNLYFVIYGMDQFLINDGFSNLKSLFELENVKVVGCINNQNSGPILNEFDYVFRRYRLIDINTNEDYTQELISLWQNNPPNFLVNKKVQKSTAQIESILEALSQNHRKLFSLICQIQLDYLKEEKKFIGIEKNSILQDKRAITICHNESKLDNLLTEFTTHDVIEQTRGPGGRLFLKVPFESHQLEHFVN